MKVTETDLSMMRGDTDVLVASLEDRPFADGDVLTLTVAYTIAPSPPIIQKVLTSFAAGEAVFEFAPADTEDLAPGEYVYDIQLVAPDVGTKTIVEPSRFELRGDVTR